MWPDEAAMYAPQPYPSAGFYQNRQQGYPPTGFYYGAQQHYPPVGFRHSAPQQYPPAGFMHNAPQRYPPRSFRRNARAGYPLRDFRQSSQDQYPSAGFRENAQPEDSPGEFNHEEAVQMLQDAFQEAVDSLPTEAEQNRKWLEQHEANSAKFEEIARKRGIEISDPKSQENHSVSLRSVSISENNETGVNITENESGRNAEDPEAGWSQDADDPQLSSGLAVSSLVDRDGSSSPVQELARRIVLEVRTELLFSLLDV